MSADIIVIGGGAAGCVIAAALSQDPAREVVLLEAGPGDYNPLLRVPLATGFLANSPMAAWRDPIEPDPGLGGRSIVWPHGKVLGGSTAINGMVWMRGRPYDFDQWTAQGLSGWTWKDALEAYRRIESGPDGAEGPQRIEVNRQMTPLDEAFLTAIGQAGHPMLPDMNTAPFEGGGRFVNTVNGGERWSAARSFLPKGRKNLTVITGAEVARIDMDRGRAVGVAYRRGGKMHSLRGGEIVLSAGTVHSAKLLMLSGVGPAAHLQDKGVRALVDLPGVGQNLQDHLSSWVAQASREPVSLHPLTRIDTAAMAVARAWATGKGPAAASPFGSGFHLKSDPSLSEPDLQGVFMPLAHTAIRPPSLRPDGLEGHGYRCAVFVMRPHSRGRVELRSDDPFAKPVIHAGYFSDRRDLELTRKGIAMVRDIYAQPAFDRYRGEELAPGPDILGDAAVEAWIPKNTSTAFHASGACKMGADTDPLAVVDDRLRVRGVEGLRIADASVMPTLTSANPMAPTMMIGRRCADFMLGNAAA